MGIGAVFVIDKGCVDGVTVRQELIIDTAAADDEYGGLGVLLQKIKSLFQRVADDRAFYLVIPVF